MLINLISGTFTMAPTAYFNSKLVHGYGMMSIWLFIFPLGAFYARFIRSVKGWIVVKVALQMFGVLGVSFFLVWVFFIEFRFDFTHAIFGSVILFLMMSQILLVSTS